MCYFITAVLPPGTRLPEAQAIAERYGRNLTPLASSGIQAQLRSGEMYCLTTVGHCDCDTSLGRAGRKRLSHQSPEEARAEKLAALGWSKAKIERAISQSAQSRERNRRRTPQSAAADTEAWVEFISAIRAARIPYLGLLLHSYRGALSQNFPIKARLLVPPLAQLREVLPGLAEDTLYEFRTEA